MNVTVVVTLIGVKLLLMIKQGGQQIGEGWISKVDVLMDTSEEDGISRECLSTRV